MKQSIKKFLSLILAANMAAALAVPSFAAETIAERNEELLMNTEVPEAAEAIEAEDFTKEAETDVPGDKVDSEGASSEDAASVMLGTESSIGDLWDGWDAFAEDAYRPHGTGSESDPYVIESTANLMWLSVNTTKKTAGVAGAYYVLSGDIDLSAVTSSDWWHPIGFYKNEAGTASRYDAPFTGHFDGRGHTISGLAIRSGKEIALTGLFGYVKDAVIENLTVESDGIKGYGELGILAAKAEGETDIRRVTVTGSAEGHSYLSVTPNIGGIAGTVNGNVVIENCRAGGVCLSVPDGSICSVGGIAGSAAGGYIVDCTTVAGLSTGLTGCGYIGGIAGQQDQTNIYNSYVNGTVGGSGTLAVGGITGRYKSGEIILAQSFVTLGDTQAYTAHEGMIVGDYDSSATVSLLFGNTKEATAAYWFVAENEKNHRYIGSGRDDDTAYTTAAHIGHWTNNELKYVLYNGTTPVSCGDTDFYYEELEDGIRFLVTQKLDRKFTITEYTKGLRFRLDHYAPAYNGVPVKGHLVSIPMINSQNSVDTDVAYLTAVAGDGSLFYKVMDMNSAAAVEPGTLVTIRSSAKNDPANNKYFQRVVNELIEPEKEVRPTYTDSSSGVTEVKEMTYQTEGVYTFLMPDSDTELNIRYEKVLSQVLTSPTETVFNIVETRTGDRKNPGISWTIRDENGHTLANAVKTGRTETGPMTEQLLTGDKVTSIAVAALFNSVSDDNKVVWSVDDPTILCMEGTASGYTAEAAQIKPEMTVVNTWLATIINQAELAQKSAAYTTKIPDTVYTRTAVLTATSDPAHSIDRKACAAHCEITLNFHIDDQTVLQVEGVSLDRDSLTYTVTRTLTGNRRAPEERWTVTGAQALKATIAPAEAFTRNVTWEITGDAATSVSGSASGDFDHDFTVASVFDGTDSLTLPAWMADLYADDNAKKAADRNYVMCGTAAKTGIITVTAEDKEKGVWTDTCSITVNYVTADETPEVDELSLNTDSLVYTVTRTLTGDRKAPAESYNITSSRKLTASLSGNAPFLENVLWSVDTALEPATVRTLSGTCNSTETIGVNFNPADIESAPAWIANAISSDDDKWKEDGKARKRNASASVEGFVTAISFDVTVPDGTAETAKCKVIVNFVTDDQTVIHPEGVEVNPVSVTEEYVITHVGDPRSEIREETGFTEKNITSVVLPNLSFTAEHLPYNRGIEWSVSDTDAVSVTQDGRLSFNKTAKWIRDARQAAPYAAAKTVSVYCTAKDNGKVGVTTVKLIFKEIALELPADSRTINLAYTASGPTTSPEYHWTGNEAFSMTGTTYPEGRSVTYHSTDPETLAIDALGNVTVAATKDTGWIKEAMKQYPYTGQKVVVLEADDPLCTDACEVIVNFKYVNSTYTPSYGGGGGGGVTGGGSSGGSAGARPNAMVSGLPSYVTGGTWREVNSLWSFADTNNVLIQNKWAAVVNPYAVAFQPKFDWFAFDPAGNMRVGWFDDTDGNRYYLSSSHDGTYGHMVVGYQYIDGAWYFFNNLSNGARGALVRNGVTQAVGTNPAGLKTDAEGRILGAWGRPEANPAAYRNNENTAESLIQAGAGR